MNNSTTRTREPLDISSKKLCDYIYNNPGQQTKSIALGLGWEIGKVDRLLMFNRNILSKGWILKRKG
jgi:hypothetical protein